MCASVIGVERPPANLDTRYINNGQLRECGLDKARGGSREL